MENKNKHKVDVIHIKCDEDDLSRDIQFRISKGYCSGVEGRDKTVSVIPVNFDRHDQRVWNRAEEFVKNIIQFDKNKKAYVEVSDFIYSIC